MLSSHFAVQTNVVEADSHAEKTENVDRSRVPVVFYVTFYALGIKIP